MSWNKDQQLSTKQTLRQALQESEEQFRTIADFTYDWEYWIDPQRKLLYVSPSCERITGYAPQEFLNNPEFLWDIVHPDDQAVIAKHRKSVQEHDDAYSCDFRIITRQGEERWIGHVCQSVFAADGRWLGRRASNRDITERKQTEEALRESEARFRRLTENAPEIIYRYQLSPERTFEYVNPVVTEITGYTPEEHYADPDLGLKLVHPEDRKLLQNISFDAPSTPVTLRWIRKDGTLIWTEQRNMPIYDERNTLIAIEGIARDVTKQKQAEETLRRMNERFALATRAARLGVWDWDIQKNELIWDERMYELYGVKREDFDGAYEAWLQGVHPDDRARSDMVSQQARRGECDYDTEFRIIRPDGAIRWLKAYGQIVWDDAGAPLRMTGVNYDITNRKQAEEALHQSEEELRLTLEATTDGIWKWNFVTNTMFFSPRYYTMLGYEPDEFPANYENWRELIHPDDRERALTTATKYLATKPDIYENEFRLRTKSGDYRWIHSYAKVVERNDRGEAVRMIGNHVDITEHKQAEGKLKASLAEKEVLLRELYHRTKNTMQVIRSMLLLQAVRMPENNQAQQLVQDTDQRIMTMALVHEKLYQSQDLSHLNLGEYLTDLSQQIVQSDALAAQRISLTCHVEPAAVLLDTAIPCGLLLNELLSNALRHAFPAERSGTITITLFLNDAGLLELRVADNGVGVPPDFDFRQQGNLGMQMIIALAERQLHGTITFSSQQGGVACQVEFPDTLYSPRV